jgi:hypothetical protein
MSGLLYPAELSRHSWPPRDRTAQYLRIRQAPSTSWVVASGWRRSRPPALARPSGFKPEPAARRVHHPERRAEVTISSDCAPTGFRNRACFPAGSLSMAEDGGHDPQGPHEPPLAFQTVTAPWRLHLPGAESGAVEAHGIARALVSSEARTLSGSLSMKHRVPFPGFEPGRHPPEGCGSASWPRRARTASGWPASNRRPRRWRHRALTY